jgi:rod shape-determining protein MreC
MMRDRHGQNYFLFFFCAAALALLSLPLTGKVQALRACISYLLNPPLFYGSQGVQRLGGLPSDAARLISHDIELQRLRRQSREAALLRAENEALIEENARLRLSSGLKPPGGRMLRWARVMERDPAHWHRSILIDAGGEEGILLNSPVLSLQGERFGVVGRVIEVFPRTSKVLLLTDEASAVAACLGEKQWDGLVQGQGTSRLRMNYLPVEAAPTVGEGVFTSPTSATFPPGLLIGTVSKIFERDPFLTLQAVEVVPAAPVGALAEVMIIVPQDAGGGA